ncbi:MAG: hypothetical protein JSU08_16145 [Acidobacteria bacterium]|nr:hypothetical protein [Acidobacteriota bacterium]
MTRSSVALLLLLCTATAHAQTVTNRGFVEGQAIGYPQKAPNDATRAVGDVLVRDDLFFKPTEWLQLAAGADLRANSHDQVEDKWRFDWEDRSLQRPRFSLRRLSATVNRGPITLDVGKQFIRWARADVLNPTDRFAPKDYMTVVNTEVMPVLGVRPTLQFGTETIEAVWVAQPTPSRLPLLNQRWALVPAGAAGAPIVDNGGLPRDRSEEGVRWRHVGGRFESALSFFNGVNHLPNFETVVTGLPTGPEGPFVPTRIDVSRFYPKLRTYGLDFAVPTSVVNVKAEAAYFTSPEQINDDYVLYVVELERQSGNWLFDAGYAGEVVTERRELFPFNPERGLAKSVVGRAAYTGDPRRAFAVEGAVRQDGGGVYVKGEFSESIGGHWRVTATGIGIGGHEDDFIGQFRRNSSGTLGLRFSF